MPATTYSVIGSSTKIPAEEQSARLVLGGSSTDPFTPGVEGANSKPSLAARPGRLTTPYTKVALAGINYVDCPLLLRSATAATFSSSPQVTPWSSLRPDAGSLDYDSESTKA